MSSVVPLSQMPDGIFCELICLDPDSALSLRVVSRALKTKSDLFLKWNAREMIALCSREDSLLYNRVCQRFVDFSLRLWSQPGCGGLRFHLSLPMVVRSLGVPPADCPNKILRAHEIARFSQWIQDDQLNRIWRRMHPGILGTHPLIVGLPGDRASAQEIRAWMDTDDGRSCLQRVTRLYLNRLGQEDVPKEAGLCTGLQRLHLQSNRLASLSEGFLSGLTRLETLKLYLNRLGSLPEGFFHGLIGLRKCDISGNQLASLPQELFHGLIGLTTLELSNNSLPSLPEGLFHGLPGLTTLELSNNSLLSLSERLFQGLPGLTTLGLTDNSLLSLSEGLFRGLSGLQELHLSNNKLISLPKGLLHGLIGLQELDLSGNRLTSLPKGLFHGLIRLQRVSLSGNGLVSLPEGLFSGPVGLQLFELRGNPPLLFSFNAFFNYQDNITIPEKMDAFFNYACKSPLALLYQLAAGGSSFAAMKISFSSLAAPIKDAIFRTIETEDFCFYSCWARQKETHFFEDRGVFNRGLLRYIMGEYRELTSQQRGVVHERMRELARNERGRREAPFDVPAGPLAYDNILRCIDAMFYEPRGTKRPFRTD